MQLIKTSIVTYTVDVPERDVQAALILEAAERHGLTHGTNLFTATQAEEMIRHMLEGPKAYDDLALDLLLEDIRSELLRTRTKFPGDNVTLLALMEEVGELAKASFEETRSNVRKETVQVAVMAIRVVLDGDATLTEWRAAKDLDRLTP